MYWLVLYIATGYPSASAAIAIVPEKYPTEKACYEAARAWPEKAKCIPAPAQTINDDAPVIKDARGKTCYPLGMSNPPSYVCK